MKTEKDWNKEIMSITLLIQKNYPELVSFLNEMTVTIPDENKPQINTQVLKEYYNSLDIMLKEYIIEHS